MNKVDNIVDSIESPQTTKTPIPQEILHATVVIGYIAGNSWLTFPIYEAALPELAHAGLILPCSLTYAIPRGTKRGIYDIEPGGGKNGNIGLFANRVDLSEPFYLYTFASNGNAMLAAAKSFGLIQCKDFFYIAAHANRVPHICSPEICGWPKADITQYLFAGSYDKSIGWDYALPGYKAPVVKPGPDAYGIFPTYIGDSRFPNQGNERLTVEQADGALHAWAQHGKYHDYLKGPIRNNIVTYRNRCWRVAKFMPPDFTNPNPHPAWADDRHLGIRWQGLENRLKQIDAIK